MLSFVARFALFVLLLPAIEVLAFVVPRQQFIIKNAYPIIRYPCCGSSNLVVLPSQSSPDSSLELRTYLANLEDEIKRAGGRILCCELGGSVKKTNGLQKMGLSKFLRKYPERFQLEWKKDKSDCYVTLSTSTEDDTGWMHLSSDMTYLNIIEDEIKRAGGRIRSNILGQLVRKPNGLPKKSLSKLLMAYPERFQLELEEGNTNFYVSLSSSTGEDNFALSQLHKTISLDADGMTATTKKESECWYTLVDTQIELEKAVSCVKEATGKLSPDGRQIISLKMEGNDDNKTLELLQIATAQSIYLVDCRALGIDTVIEAFRDVLSSERYIILMHNVREDMKLDKAYYGGGGGITLSSLLDTQLVAEHIFGDPFIERDSLLQRLKNSNSNPQEYYSDDSCRSDKVEFKPMHSRPFSEKFLQYAASDVSCLLETVEYIFWNSTLEATDFEMLTQATMFRVSDTLTYGNKKRPIGFLDEKNGFRLASAELLRALFPPGDDQKCCLGQPIVVESCIQDVIQILPRSMQDAFNEEENSKISPTKEEAVAMIPAQEISDIMLDIGARPHCWLQNRRRFLWENSNQRVSSNDIDAIVENLGNGLGRDGRATLPDSLNRISALKGRFGEILGFTIRIGRSIRNTSDLLLDYLLGTEKSILILGKPASGKTSIIRDLARRLAETKSVVVIDKSNEIGGDGPVPHESLGMARRMMVPKDSQQDDVMIECVENHAPEAIVIDEIGCKRQVQSAKTVKDRGVRMIASSHGDFCTLIDNPVLNDLVGGIESVVIGDVAAFNEEERRENMSRSQRQGFVCERQDAPPKIKTQRSGQPVFDIVVEVSAADRNTWKVIPNTARAVDEILDGLSYHAHLRSRNPETGRMFIEFPNDFCSCTEPTANK